MPQEPTTVTALQPNRPLFLTVLCILGFLGSITSIITNGIGFFKSETEVTQILSGTEKTQLKNLFSFGKDAATAPLEISNLTPENFEKYSIGGIVAGLLCLIGVILMWLHKKSGFYSFVLGTFFNIITHFLLFGDNIGAMGLSMLWALIGLVLVVLYSKFLNSMD
jgi:small basic protein